MMMDGLEATCTAAIAIDAIDGAAAIFGHGDGW